MYVIFVQDITKKERGGVGQEDSGDEESSSQVNVKSFCTYVHMYQGGRK